jgi:hypothetical protein
MFCANGAAQPANSPSLPTLDPQDPLAQDAKTASYLNFVERSLGWPKIFSQDNQFEALQTTPDLQGSFVLLSGVADRNQNPPQRFSLVSIIRLAIGEPKKEVTYRIAAPTYLHTPQFSYDKKSILIRIGSAPADRFGTIGLLLWNLQSGTFHYVNAAGHAPFIYYPAIQFSPGSRYLSYLKGGNAFGDYDQWTKSYRLYICDLRTYQDRLIAVDAGQNWSWTCHGSVLFTRFEAKDAYAVAQRTARPSIYEADAKGSLPKKIFSGGYFAQESPNGQWIAFCDWPGTLIDMDAPQSVKDNTERGLFLFNRASKMRTFIGPLKLEFGQPPLLQWSPDSKELFVLDSWQDAQTLNGTIYKVEIEQPKLKKLSEFSLIRPKDVDSTNKVGFFMFRGCSPSGQYVYVDTVQVIDGPQGYVNTRRTLVSVDTTSGQQTSIAQLTNIANANPDWDWHDDSGINPAFAAAEKIENALPVLRAGEKDVDPTMNQPASAPAAH